MFIQSANMALVGQELPLIEGGVCGYTNGASAPSFIHINLWYLLYVGGTQRMHPAYVRKAKHGTVYNVAKMKMTPHVLYSEMKSICDASTVSQKQIFIGCSS